MKGLKYFDFGDFFASFKWISQDERPKFEKEFAQYLGVKFAIGTSYGRTALYLGLKAVDVDEKEVIIPAFICTVVRHAVIMAGGIPRFVDIDMEKFTLNLDDLKRKISEKTKAIILPHYFGRVARNIQEIIQIAKENKLLLIEDCAHVLGAEWNGRKVGTLGDFSIFSLTKNMINCGGGILVTNEYDIYRNAKRILDEEKMDLKKRTVDFPLVVAYGLEQSINKTVFDRVGKSLFKWWLANLPKLILVIRKYMVALVKLPLSVSKFENKKKKYSAYKRSNKKVFDTYKQSIHMEPIIASLARTQLRKIDSLIQQREKICNHLTKLTNYHFRDSGGFICKDVYTHVVLRFSNSDIFELIAKCKKSGLLLRATWPTHQKLWENQDTENVRIIEKEFLTWDVNPMVTEQEIKTFLQIVSESNNQQNSK